MITISTTTKKDPLPPLVKVREVAEILSISRHTVHNLIQRGDLQASKINPSRARRLHLRITRESLLRFYKTRFGHPLNRALKMSFDS